MIIQSTSHREAEIHKEEVQKSHLPQPMIDFDEFESVFHRTSLAPTKVRSSYEGSNCIAKYNNVTSIESTSSQASHQPHSIPYLKDAHHTSFFDCISSRQVEAQQSSQVSTVYQNISSSIAVPGPLTSNNTLLLSELPCMPIVYNANQSADIMQNCQIVDEIVETRAKELSDWHDGVTEYNSQPEVPLSPTPKANEDDLSRMSSSSSSSMMIAVDSSSNDSSGKMKTGDLFKNRMRPYVRDLGDANDLKKEQNKLAATRYRQKKKQEMEIILKEEKELSNRNMILQSMLAERKCEVKYLKKLIRESFQNKQF